MTPIVHDYDFHGLLGLRIRRGEVTRADSFLDSTFAHYRVERLTGDPDIDVEIGPGDALAALVTGAHRTDASCLGLHAVDQ